MNQEKKKMNAGAIIGIVLGSIVALIVIIFIAFMFLKPKVYTEKEITSCTQKTATEKITNLLNTDSVSDDINKVESEYKNNQIDWEHDFVDSLKTCLGVKKGGDILVDSKEKSINSYVEDTKMFAEKKEKEIIENSGLTMEKVKSAYLKILAMSNSASEWQTNSENVNTLAKYANVKPYIFLQYIGLHATEMIKVKNEIQEEIIKKARSLV